MTLKLFAAITGTNCRESPWTQAADSVAFDCNKHTLYDVKVRSSRMKGESWYAKDPDEKQNHGHACLEPAGP